MMKSYKKLSETEYKKVLYHLRGLLFSGFQVHELTALGYPENIVIEAWTLNKSYLQNKRRTL